MKTIKRLKAKFKAYIIKLAKKFLTENLEIYAIEKTARKGTRRYRFITYYTPHGRIRYQLGRHWEIED